MNIPDTFPHKYSDRHADFNIKDTMDNFKLRSEWMEQGMYAFVSWEWVDPFIAWLNGRKVLEVMSGAGWLARALREKGITMFATDDYSWADKRNWPIQTVIEQIDCIAAVEKYGKLVDVLIISWPWMDEQAYLCIKKMHEVNPDCIIVYIGEGDGGCTASDTFFAAFNEITDDILFKEVAKNFYGWWGIHDHPMIGRYQQISDEVWQEISNRKSGIYEYR